MLVECMGVCYYYYFKKQCVVYKKDNIEIVRDVVENKILCFVYSGIAFELTNPRYKDIENINFEKIIKEENPTTEKKPYLFNLSE